jgi:hypothetical protein
MSASGSPAVDRLLDAATSHDTEAFLASFTEDGWRSPRRSRTGDETTITAQVGGKGFNGPSHFTFKVRDDLVARMTIRE